MKIKLLPNWCKKLGLGVFLIGFIVSGFKGFMSGLTACNPKTTKYDFFINMFSVSIMHVFEVLAVIGMLIYLLSKEKVEDDYINKLRLESYQLISLLSLLLALGLYVFSGSLKFSLDYLINLFLMSYLIIFALKKRIY